MVGMPRESILYRTRVLFKAHIQVYPCRNVTFCNFYNVIYRIDLLRCFSSTVVILVVAIVVE